MSESNYQKTKDEFTDYLQSKGYTNSSIKSRIQVFTIYWQWLEEENIALEQIAYTDLLSFMKWCNKKGASQRTIQNYMGAIKHLYTHLIREGIITKNPATDIDIKGVKRKSLYYIFQPTELNTIYNQHKDESLKGRRDKVILGLLIYQGIKPEELKKLEVKDVQLREGKIEVPGGKKSNGRTMKLESHQVMDMYDYILQTRPEIIRRSKQETDKLLVSEAGGTDISNFMSRLMARLKKKNTQIVNANQIRASVITKWLRIYNLREVQYLAGHRYISSTESFLENETEGLSNEVQQYHPLG